MSLVYMNAEGCILSGIRFSGHHAVSCSAYTLCGGYVESTYFYLQLPQAIGCEHCAVALDEVYDGIAVDWWTFGQSLDEEE